MNNWWEDDPIATLDAPQDEWWQADPVVESVSEPEEQAYTGPKFSDPISDPWKSATADALSVGESIPEFLTGKLKPSAYQKMRDLEDTLSKMQGDSPAKAGVQDSLDIERRRIRTAESQAQLAKERYDTFAAENKDSEGVIKERLIRDAVSAQYQAELGKLKLDNPAAAGYRSREQIEADVRRKFDDIASIATKYGQKKEEERLVAENPTASINMASRQLVDTPRAVVEGTAAVVLRVIGAGEEADEVILGIQERTAARKVGQGAVAGFVEDVGSTLGTAAVVAPFGGIPALTAYYAATTANELYAETKNIPYAITGGVIEGGMTFLGGKYLGAGVGQFASRLGGKGVSNVASKIVKRALTRAGAPKWLKATSPYLVAGGGEVLEEDITELLHGFNDYFVNGNDKAFDGMLGRLAYTSGVALAAGGAGGALAGLGKIPLRQRKQIASGLKQAADEMKAGMKGVEAAVAATENTTEPIPVPPASRNGFEKATGLKRTKEAERNGYIDTVEEFNRRLAESVETEPQEPQQWTKRDTTAAKAEIRKWVPSWDADLKSEAEQFASIYPHKVKGLLEDADEVYQRGQSGEQDFLLSMFREQFRDSKSLSVFMSKVRAKEDPSMVPGFDEVLNDINEQTGAQYTEDQLGDKLKANGLSRSKVTKGDALREVLARFTPETKETFDEEVQTDATRAYANQTETPQADATQAQRQVATPAGGESVPQPPPEALPEQPTSVRTEAAAAISGALHDAIPGARLQERSPGQYQVDLPNGRFFTLELAPELKSRSKKYIDFLLKVNGLENTPENRKRMRNRGGIGRFTIGTPEGEVIDGLGVMKVLDRLDQPRMTSTIRHEAVHVARAFGLFTDQEWNALVNEHSDPARPQKRQEEDIAKATKLWGGDRGLGQRIKDLLNRFLSFLRVTPLSASNAQRSLTTGKVFTREAKRNRQAVAEAAMQSSEALAMEQQDEELFDKGTPEGDRYRDRANLSTDPAKRQEIYKQDVAHGPPKQKDWATAEAEATRLIQTDYDNQLAKWLANAQRSRAEGGISTFETMTDAAVARKLTLDQIGRGIRGDKQAAANGQLLNVYGWRDARSEHARILNMRDPLGNTAFARQEALLAAWAELTQQPLPLTDQIPATQPTEPTSGRTTQTEIPGTEGEKAKSKTADILRGGAEGIAPEKVLGALKQAGIDFENFDEIAASIPLTLRTMSVFKQLSSSTSERVFEYWRNAILSAFKTLVVNAGGGAYGIYHTLGERFAAGVANVALRRKGEATLGEMPHVIAGILPGITRGLQNALITWRYEIPSLEIQLGKLTHEQIIGRDEMLRGVIPGKWGKRIRIPYRVLGATDQFVKSILYEMEVAGLAYRKGKAQGLKGEELGRFMASETGNPMSDSATEAYLEAKHGVFQGNPGVVANAVGIGVDVVRKVPVAGKYVAPFKETPANIFEQAAKRLPVVGSLVDLRNHYRNRKLSPEQRAEAEPVQLTEAIARQAIALAGLALMWATNDPEEPWITGTYKKEQSYKPYPPQSVYIPGYGWLSYSRVDPFSSMLASTVDFSNSIRSGKRWGVANDLRKSLGRQFKDKTYIEGLSDLAMLTQGVLGDDEKLEEGLKLPANVIVGFVPNVYRDTVKSGRNELAERDTWGKGTDYWTHYAKRMAQDAQLRFDAPPKVDVMGRDIQPFMDSNSFAYRVLAPFRTKDQAEVTPYEEAIGSWNAYHPDESLEIGAPPKHWKQDGETKYLSDEQYYIRAKLAGQYFRDSLGVDKLLAGLDPQKPTKDQIVAIKAIAKNAKATATANLKPYWADGKDGSQLLAP